MAVRQMRVTVYYDHDAETYYALIGMNHDGSPCFKILLPEPLVLVIGKRYYLDFPLIDCEIVPREDGPRIYEIRYRVDRVIHNFRLNWGGKFKVRAPADAKVIPYRRDWHFYRGIDRNDVGALIEAPLGEEVVVMWKQLRGEKWVLGETRLFARTPFVKVTSTLE